MDEWESSVTLSKISFASNYFYDFGMVSHTLFSARLTQRYLHLDPGLPQIEHARFLLGRLPIRQTYVA